MKNSDYFTFIGVILSFIIFVVGLLQYRKAQTWKRLQFVADETEKAFSDKHVQIALTMLDWNAKKYDLVFLTNNPVHSQEFVNDDLLIKALVPHTFRLGGFNVVKAAIRTVFDELFDRLQRFEHFIQADLIKPDDVKPYLRYWLDILGNPNADRKPTELIWNIWRYLDFYGYQDVQTLLKRFGYSLKKNE